MKIFRNGKVHVLEAMCVTCIFRPGNLMNLQPGRVRQMVREATRNATSPLQIAQRLGFIQFDPPPKQNQGLCNNSNATNPGNPPPETNRQS